VSCDEVQRLATNGQLEEAIARFSTCTGGNQDAVLKTIDAAVLQELDKRGCEAFELIRTASKIGAKSARQPYVDKGCGPGGKPVTR
jgi:hypothetical protein